MSEFRGEMKTLVQTYVELLYPDDLEMQDALFENITTGKASVTVDEMRDYVATRSSWYAEIEAVNPAMAVVHNQNDEFVGTVEVMDMDDDPDGVEVFINDEQMNEISSINLYEDDRFWEDYDAETFNADRVPRVMDISATVSEDYWEDLQNGSESWNDVEWDIQYRDVRPRWYNEAETFNAMSESDKANRRFDRAWIKAMQKFADNPDNQPLLVRWIAQDLLFNLEIGQNRYGYTALTPIYVSHSDDEGNPNHRLRSSLYPQTAFRELELSGKIATGNLERFKRFQDPYGSECFWVYSYKDENGQRKTYASPRNDGNARQDFTGAVYRGEVKLPSSVKDEIPAILELRRKANRKQLTYIRKTQKIQLELDKEALEKGQKGAEDIAQMMLGVKKIDSFKHFNNAETFNAMSFKQWSQDEMNEELHGGQDMDFDSWLNDEIHTHGNIPLREWGYEEEHDEPEHQHAEFGLFTPHPSPPEPKDKLTGEDGYYTLPQIKRMIARDMIYHSSDGDVDFNDIFDDNEIEILTSWADEAGEDVREYIEDRFLTYSELVTAVTNASSLKGMQRIFEAYKFPYRVTADRKLSDGSYEYKLELIPKFKKAQAESMMSEDYMTDEEILRAARNDIDNQISRGTFYTLGQEPQAFHDGEIDGENFYTIISLYCQYAEDEDRCEKKLRDMFKKDYAKYMGDESFYAESMMSKRGKVRTLSGKPHKARKMMKDKNISPEEAKTRLSFRARKGMDAYAHAESPFSGSHPISDEQWEFVQKELRRKGIDTYAEPFEEIGNFYSGKKGILKIVGLGALVSAGVWITKNKLLE